MSLKNEFTAFVKHDLQVPLVGIAAADDIPNEDIERISFVIKTFSTSTPLAEGIDGVLHPRDFITEARSIIVTGMPGYFGNVASFEDCRAKLLGKAEPSHVNTQFLERGAGLNSRITSFFADKGFQCFSLIGIQYPIKLAAAQAGVGFYGKNSIIQHPDYGSWISLTAFVTDAVLEPDKPLPGDCGSCELCLKACPTGALFAPYRCDVTRCIDFHLGHNKKTIPSDILDKTGNLLGEGCTICRDVCPKNHKLTPFSGFETPGHLLYPPLLSILEMSDEEWENGYALTLMGFFLMEKRFLQRNAAISLGNFRDQRAIEALERFGATEDDDVRQYAEWALGKIKGEE
jgi:epoxyqueuosine reductase QueG